MMQEMKVPIVLVMRTFPRISKDAVITDDYRGAYEAVCHLARAGRKRIGLIGGPRKISNGKARWEGFRDALKANNLLYDSALVIEGDYRVESGYRGGNLLLSHRPDGVYVANYLMTVGLLKAAEEMGLRCPEDFGLVSFDDYPWLGIFRPSSRPWNCQSINWARRRLNSCWIASPGKMVRECSKSFSRSFGLENPADSSSRESWL